MVRFSVNILFFFVQRYFRVSQHADNKKPTKNIAGFLLETDVPDYSITPNCFPTLINAAIALSRCARVCPADSCTRMRACSLGTTG